MPIVSKFYSMVRYSSNFWKNILSDFYFSAFFLAQSNKDVQKNVRRHGQSHVFFRWILVFCIPENGWCLEKPITRGSWHFSIWFKSSWLWNCCKNQLVGNSHVLYEGKFSIITSCSKKTTKVLKYKKYSFCTCLYKLLHIYTSFV